MDERYFVDKRGGCVAIRDRHHPDHDPDYRGLHHDTPGVVVYIHGQQIIVDGVFKGWTISPLDVEKCKIRCEELNYD